MKIAELIKQLQDIMLIYGNKIILTITDDSGNEYKVKDITGQQCAKYFEPEDHVAEAIIRICRGTGMGKCRYDLLEDCHNKDCLKCVLDKISTEIMSLTDDDTPERIWNVDVLEIIDKYKEKVRTGHE